MKRFSFILVVLAALVFSACSDGSSDNTDSKDSGPTTERGVTGQNPFNATQEEIDCGLYDDSVSADEYIECLGGDSSASQEEVDCGLFDDSVSVDEYAVCMDPFDATQAEIDCGIYDDSVSVDEYVECMNPRGSGNGPSLQ